MTALVKPAACGPARALKNTGESVCGPVVQGSLALAGVLTIAVAVRLWAILTHTYILQPDETYQYFEQGHRLAFGSGVVPWEYHDGIRSWLLPSAIGGLMRFVALFSDAPHTYIVVVRLVCIGVSLAVPYVAFRITDRQFGRGPALVAGLLCALWCELVYYAPVAMTEEPAGHIALLAFWFGYAPSAGAPLSSKRLVLAGVLFGLAVCLRYQYGPALAVAALWQHGCDRRRLLLVGGAAIAMTTLGSGVLDALTLGAPFQSIWLNFRRNALDGLSGAMGVEPWFFLPGYFVVAWGILFPVFVALAGFGASTAPALAVAAAATVLLHSLTPHKEVRFIYLALAAAPVLIGLGAARLLALPVLRRRPGAIPAACAIVILIAGVEAFTASTHAMPPDAWRVDRSITRAFFAAHAVTDLCGLGVANYWAYRTGGYSYLHRDVPIYFETFERAQHIPGSRHRLTLSVVRNGSEVPQYPDSEFAATGTRFNVLIAPEGNTLPGFSPIGCFGTDGLSRAEVCLFHRPGDCL